MKNEEKREFLNPASREFLDRIQSLHNDLDALIKQKMDRSLPFTELLFDRWDRGKNMNFGEGTSIYESAIVIGDVSVGRSTWIGPWVILDGSGGLSIGDFCSISAGVHIYSHNTVSWALSGGKDAYVYKPARIGNNCFIGPQSIVQNGVTIGDHCLVAANSFVSKDVEPYTIVGGSPAKKLGHVKVLDDGSVALHYQDRKN